MNNDEFFIIKYTLNKKEMSHDTFRKYYVTVLGFMTLLCILDKIWSTYCSVIEWSDNFRNMRIINIHFQAHYSLTSKYGKVILSNTGYHPLLS
jgi:hypothetical protein